MPELAKPLVLIIDDRRDMFEYSERCLGRDFAFRHVPGGRAAREFLATHVAAAALVDRDFSHADPDQLLGPRDDVRNEGLAVLRWLRKTHPALPTVMVTGHRDLPTAIAADDLGADFLAWEEVVADPAGLAARLQVALEQRHASSGAARQAFRRLGIVTESAVFGKSLCDLYLALPGRAPILLLGPTGSGKDTLARAAHSLAGDPARPYVEVNIAALNPNVIESELFGHRKGAFTNATHDSTGKMRAADGGTLFLNEIGDVPLDVQAKLLTALERSEVTPVGDIRSYRAEFRLITATSRDLRQLVEQGRFRPDLLYRIAGYTIDLPPLRDRLIDIPALANMFLQASPAGRSGIVVAFANEAMELMAQLPWPGNVRELQRIVEVACAHARHTVTVSDVRDAVEQLARFLPAAVVADPAASRTRAYAEAAAAGPSHDRLAAEEAAFNGLNYDDLTRAYYYFLMRATGGHMAAAATLAGIAKGTIYEWRKRYAVSDDEGRREMGGTA